MILQAKLGRVNIDVMSALRRETDTVMMNYFV
jgi:hypothetical protein